MSGAIKASLDTGIAEGEVVGREMKEQARARGV